MLNKIKKWIDMILKIIITSMFSFLVLLTFANIITRNMFSYSILWAEEVSRHLFVWIIFLGISYAVLNSSLMSISMVTDIMRKKHMDLLCHVIYWISCLIFFSILAYYGIQYTIIGYGAMSSMLGIHMSLVYAALPYCGISCVVFIIFDIILYFQNSSLSLRGKEEV